MPDQMYNNIHGVKMAQLGLGTFLAEKNVVRDTVIEALRIGYRHIDCAELYKNQEEIGEAFNQIFNVEKSVKRADVWITSKYFITENPDQAMINVKQTVKDLQLDYIDLYLIHFPSGFEVSRNRNNVADLYKRTWQVFERIVETGLVRHIGVSNMSCKKLDALRAYAKQRIFTNQVEIHPYWRNDRLIKYCKEAEIHLTAYSVLGTPSFNPDVPSPLKNEVVIELAEKYNKDVGQILIRWGLQRGYAVLAKTVTPKRLASNFQVFDFELSKEDVERLSTLPKQFRIVSGDFLVGEDKSFASIEELWDGEV